MTNIYREPGKSSSNKTIRFQNGQSIWTDISQKKTYQWQINTWKNALKNSHCLINLKLQLDFTSQLLEWLFLNFLSIWEAGGGRGILDPFTSRMFIATWTKPGWNQKLQIQARSPSWLTGIQLLAPSTAVSQGAQSQETCLWSQASSGSAVRMAAVKKMEKSKYGWGHRKRNPLILLPRM